MRGAFLVVGALIAWTWVACCAAEWFVAWMYRGES